MFTLMFIIFTFFSENTILKQKYYSINLFLIDLGRPVIFIFGM